jgi:hypothetical protein
VQRLCSVCGRRPAKFKYKREFRADPDHDLCLQCFRSLRESNDQKEIHMTDTPETPETPHIHGTPIRAGEPQSVKELYEWTKAMFAKFVPAEGYPVDGGIAAAPGISVPVPSTDPNALQLLPAPEAPTVEETAPEAPLSTDKIQ